MIRRKNEFGKDAYWWGCTGWPRCTVTCAEHPDGTLMSTPADFLTKALRRSAHELCDKIWGQWRSPNCDKKAMYDWLKANTRTGHIGLLTYSELEKLIIILKQYDSDISRLREKRIC
jgi:ssDNA-binding Zn-finger/Zn-ribbon topoisomerase 1